jgi:hypothetical protein
MLRARECTPTPFPSVVVTFRFIVESIKELGGASLWLPTFSFGCNLCFKYTNGSCEPILDIFVLRTFQWYKELFNLMTFDPYNRLLKIWESIGTPTLKVGTHLGVCGFIPSHFRTFLGVQNVIPELHFWLTPLQALALVANPRLRLWQVSSCLARWISFNVGS